MLGAGAEAVELTEVSGGLEAAGDPATTDATDATGAAAGAGAAAGGGALAAKHCCDLRHCVFEEFQFLMLLVLLGLILYDSP